jgi:hypothetical protein
MAWENRKDRGRYYTRSRRVGGRVVREYFGSGTAGEQAAAEDRQRRLEHDQRRLAWKILEDELEATDDALETIDAICRFYMRAVLESAGFRQHDRGEWRKKRND